MDSTSHADDQLEQSNADTIVELGVVDNEWPEEETLTAAAIEVI